MILYNDILNLLYSLDASCEHPPETEGQRLDRLFGLEDAGQLAPRAMSNPSSEAENIPVEMGSVDAQCIINHVIILAVLSILNFQ